MFSRQVYPTLLLVLVVCFIYAVISPFIMPAGAIFFSLSYVVYKHQVIRNSGVQYVKRKISHGARPP